MESLDERNSNAEKQWRKACWLRKCNERDMASLKMAQRRFSSEIFIWLVIVEEFSSKTD
jgi:hypothetical protein